MISSKSILISMTWEGLKWAGFLIWLALNDKRRSLFNEFLVFHSFFITRSFAFRDLFLRSLSLCHWHIIPILCHWHIIPILMLILCDFLFSFRFFSSVYICIYHFLFCSLSIYYYVILFFFSLLVDISIPIPFVLFISLSLFL